MDYGSSPYSRALLAYWQGDETAGYTIHRDDGFCDVIPAADAFGGAPFSPLEGLALERATGRVLDVGAGVGRHSLALQQRGRQVASIEIEPGLVQIMRERGVIDANVADIFSYSAGPFDTLLMLMNGFGLIGRPGRASAFFESARRLLGPEGQILCDSFDVHRTRNPVHLAYHEVNRLHGRAAGWMRFSIEYQGQRGEPFDWLHLDFAALRALARDHGWSAELLAEEGSGHYLARLVQCPPAGA